MAMSQKEKTWKDGLLSSGVPLEYAVKLLIAELDVTAPAEFNYFRVNETGQTAEFSVDLHALMIEQKTFRFFAELFIEFRQLQS
jgi:hypothetical protein